VLKVYVYNSVCAIAYLARFMYFRPTAQHTNLLQVGNKHDTQAPHHLWSVSRSAHATMKSLTLHELQYGVVMPMHMSSMLNTEGCTCQSSCDIERLMCYVEHHLFLVGSKVVLEPASILCSCVRSKFAHQFIQSSGSLC
jgi:hypothetical protein